MDCEVYPMPTLDRCIHPLSYFEFPCTHALTESLCILHNANINTFDLLKYHRPIYNVDCKLICVAIKMATHVKYDLL